MNEKKALFNKLFPERVEKLIDKLRVLEHCSKPHMERNQELTEKVWIELAKHFKRVAHKFGVKFKVQLNNTEIYYD